MTTHNTQEQDLRTALEGAERALRPFSDCVYNDNGDVSVSDTGRCGLPEFTAAYSAQRAALSTLLAAPPRPVDAGGVEAAAAEYDRWGTGYNSRRVPGRTSWVGRKNDDGSWHEVSAHGSENEAASECHARALAAAIMAASPVQAPGKAAEREGLTDALVDALALPHAGDRERIAAVIEKRWDALVGPAAGSGIGLSRRTMCQEFAAALAPKPHKPSGTEAERGVDTEDDENPHLCLAQGIEDSLKVLGRVTLDSTDWAMVTQALRAATPTPPVSPTPDSTGPAGAYRHEWCQPGDQPKRHWLVKFEDTDKGEAVFTDEAEAREFFDRADGGGWNCWLFAAVPRAALTPSAPIAAPSPDSTGQGDAQTQEGGR